MSTSIVHTKFKKHLMTYHSAETAPKNDKIKKLDTKCITSKVTETGNHIIQATEKEEKEMEDRYGGRIKQERREGRGGDGKDRRMEHDRNVAMTNLNEHSEQRNMTTHRSHVKCSSTANVGSIHFGVVVQQNIRTFLVAVRSLHTHTMPAPVSWQFKHN